MEDPKSIIRGIRGYHCDWLNPKPVETRRVLSYLILKTRLYKGPKGTGELCSEVLHTVFELSPEFLKISCKCTLNKFQWAVLSSPEVWVTSIGVFLHFFRQKIFCLFGGLIELIGSEVTAAPARHCAIARNTYLGPAVGSAVHHPGLQKMNLEA